VVHGEFVAYVYWCTIHIHIPVLLHNTILRRPCYILLTKIRVSLLLC